MNPRVTKVSAAENYRLELIFTNGETKIFDLKPYLNTGQFADLKDEEMFESVECTMGSIEWKNGLDLCPDTLYEESVPYLTRQKSKPRVAG